MSNNGQVIAMQLSSWNHAHTCYVCQKLYNCTWNFCQQQTKRNCEGCRQQLRLQVKESN